MKRLPTIVYAALSAMVLFGGCASTEKAMLSPNFWQERDHTIGVALVAFPKSNVQNFGSGMGLMDEARMASATALLKKRLQRTYPKNFTRIQELFAEKLKTTGFKVIKIEEKINPKFDRIVQPNEYSSIVLKAGVDRLILLQLYDFGVSCIFMGTYPQGTQVKAWVKGEMIDVKSNKVLWRTKFSEGMFNRDVVAKCIEPGDYPIIIDALLEEIDKGVIYLYESFFGEKPGPS